MASGEQTKKAVRKNIDIERLLALGRGGGRLPIGGGLLEVARIPHDERIGKTLKGGGEPLRADFWC
jgi:hypothetical protein